MPGCSCGWPAPELWSSRACPEPTGQAKLTPAFNLPCRYVSCIRSGQSSTAGLTDRDRPAARLLLPLLSGACGSSISWKVVGLLLHFHRRIPLSEPTGRCRSLSRPVKDFMKKETSIKKVIFNVFKETDRAIYRELLRSANAAEAGSWKQQMPLSSAQAQGFPPQLGLFIPGERLQENFARLCPAVPFSRYVHRGLLPLPFTGRILGILEPLHTG